MIIGISGKINSGKDTVGEIIRALTNVKNGNTQLGYIEYSKAWLRNKGLFNDEEHTKTGGGQEYWKMKKFADSLKDMTCLLLGCTREQLEDREYKEKELGEEWWYWVIYGDLVDYKSRKESEFKTPLPDLIKLTPRKILQLLGTEAGRQIIHPNIWVNALMSNYKLILNKWDDKGNNLYPDWIITDMRFPNELEAVKAKGGITIRVNRGTEFQKCLDNSSYFYENYVTINGEKPEVTDMNREFFKNYKLKNPQHESETALDTATFDYQINNNGTIDELIHMVKDILTKEKLL